MELWLVSFISLIIKHTFTPTCPWQDSNPKFPKGIETTSYQTKRPWVAKIWLSRGKIWKILSIKRNYLLYNLLPVLNSYVYKIILFYSSLHVLFLLFYFVCFNSSLFVSSHFSANLLCFFHVLIFRYIYKYNHIDYQYI